jgi:four helix bundle protein
MRTHRSLLAWQEAHEVVKGVVSLSFTSWKPQVGAIFAQLQRSSLSAQINLSEGYAFGPSGKMKYHYAIAYASAVETDDLLDLLRELDLADQTTVEKALGSCRKSQQLMMGLLRRYGYLTTEGVRSEK